MASLTRVPYPCGGTGVPVAGDGTAYEVGPLRAGDGDVDEAADRQVVGHVDDAVDLGRLVHRAAAGRARRRGPGGVAPMSASRLAAVMASCSSAHSRRRSRASSGGTCVVEAGGVGPVLAREGEEAGPVELRRGEELEQEIVVALGLARVAEDEGGAEGGVGLGGPDVGDAAQEAVAVAPAAHAGQQRTRDVLQREVEVRHAGGEHGLDQLVGQPGGIEVEQAGALDPRPTRRG